MVVTLGWKTENKGMTCLTTKRGEKIRRATMYALPVAGIGNIEKKKTWMQKKNVVVGGGDKKNKDKEHQYRYHRIDKGNRTSVIQMALKTSGTNGFAISFFLSRDHGWCARLPMHYLFLLFLLDDVMQWRPMHIPIRAFPSAVKMQVRRLDQLFPLSFPLHLRLGPGH